MPQNTVKRRVQVVGGSTYSVSLPKDWARNAGIKPGSEVSMEILPDYTLRIIPLGVVKPSREEVEEIAVTSKNVDLAIQEILSAYLAGYSVIRIKYSNDVDPDAIHRIVSISKNKALGLDLLEERTNELVLYSIIDTTSFTINKILEKMMHTTRFMLEDVSKCFTKHDPSILHSVIDRDDVVDKLFLLAMKQLIQVLAGEITPSSIGIDILPQAIYIVLIAKNVERVADHAALIASNMMNIPNTNSLNQLAEPFIKSKEAYVEAMRSYLNKDKSFANRSIALAKKAKELERRARKRLSSNSPPPELHLILDSIRRIRSYSTDIVESVMNLLSIRKALKSRLTHLD